MLRALLSLGLTALALVAVVLLFTDRGCFAWVLAGTALAAAIPGTLIMGLRDTRRRRT